MLPEGGQHVADYRPEAQQPHQHIPELRGTRYRGLRAIESDSYILAERAMYFGEEGTDTAGAISPRTSGISRRAAPAAL